MRKAQEELKDYVRRARARRGSDASRQRPASDKDLTQLDSANLRLRNWRRRRRVAVTAHTMEDKLVEFANLLRAKRRPRLARRDARRASPPPNDRAGRARRVSRGAARHDDQARERVAGLRRAVRRLLLGPRRNHQAGRAGRCRTRSRCPTRNSRSSSTKSRRCSSKQGKKLSELAQAAACRTTRARWRSRLREAARAVRLQGIERTIEENYFARALARAARPGQARSRRSSELREQTREDGVSAPSSRPRWRSTSTGGSRRSTTSSAATCGWSARSAISSARRAAAQPARREELLLPDAKKS